MGDARSSRMPARSSFAYALLASRSSGIFTNAGIAERLVAVDERPLERARQPVQRGGAAPRRDVRPGLEDVQRLHQRDAARRRRRHRDEAVAAIRRGDGRAPHGLIAGQVGRRDDAAALPHLVDDGRGDRARVEAVPALARDAFERAREIRLHEPRARRPAAGRRAGRAPPRRTGRSASAFCSMDVRKMSSTTKPSRARRMAGAITRARGSVPCFSSSASRPATLPGTPDARCPTSDASVGLPSAPMNMSREAAAGAGLTVVERGGRAVCEAQHGVAAAADVAGLGIRDREGEPDGHRGVHRVAAGLEDLDAGLGGERAVGRHHPVSAPTARRRRGDTSTPPGTSSVRRCRGGPAAPGRGQARQRSWRERPPAAGSARAPRTNEESGHDACSSQRLHAAGFDFTKYDL